MMIISIPKKPITALIPIGSSGAFMIPMIAGSNIVKKMNQKMPKTTPFFLVKTVLLLLSSASCGRNPPYPRT